MVNTREYNKKRFSIFESEEKTALELMNKLAQACNEVLDRTDEVEILANDNKNNKVSYNDLHTKYQLTTDGTNANYIGAWHGIKKPTASNEGLAATVDKIVEEDIPGINEKLDTKASEVDLKTLESRMNSFTTLSEGSTTGDAELIDGRTTFSGKTESNIGTAIRNQVSYLNDNLMERTENLINVDMLLVGKSFNTSTLQYQDNSNWVSSVFIPVEPLTQYQFSCNNGLQLTNKAIGINEDKTVATALTISAGKFTTNEDTKYVIMSTNNTTTVSNYKTWVLIKGNYKGDYIPYFEPKYKNIVVQELGDSEEKVVSQKALTTILNSGTLEKNATEHNLFTPKKYRYFMHRGFSYFSETYTAELAAPENSIPAFENAGIVGADGIETDVCETSDGYFVMCHDTTVDRTTDGSGTIANMTLEQVRMCTIDYGANLSKYSNLKIPTLEEYLEICIKYGCIPIIEIKAITNYEKFYSILEYYGLVDNCIVICTQTGSMDKIRELTDRIIICKNIYADEDYITTVNEYSKYKNVIVQFQKDVKLTKEVISNAHSKGVVCGIWTINYESQKSTYGLGLDYAIVDILPLRP